MLKETFSYPTPRLPLDIQLLVVDEATSDPLLHQLVMDLRLIYRALVASCRRYLFSSVSNDKLDILLPMLEVSPHLSNDVKELHVDLQEMHLQPIAYADNNIQFFGKLSPKHICIGDNNTERTQYDIAYDWIDLRPDLAQTILELVQPPSAFASHNGVHQFSYTDNDDMKPFNGSRGSRSYFPLL